MITRHISKIAGISGMIALAACTPPNGNLELLEGPPIEDVVTPIDQALQCLNDKISARLAFSVGPIPDLTGRESYNDGGAGKYVSQGASDIVQSALFKSGVTIVNRRSMGIPQTEASWGLRDIKTQMPVNLFISGSVNTLDFIPGGGASLGVRGVGARYRQNRILVGMDLAVTNAANGQVVANIPLQKQIFSDETGAFTHRFFGTTLVNMDAGVQRREALNMALRQMLYLATYELLTQLLPPEKYEACSALIDEEFGGVSGIKTSGEQLQILNEARASAEAEAAAQAEAEAAAQAEAEAAKAEESLPEEAPVAEAEPASAPQPEPETQTAALAARPEAEPAQSKATAEIAPEIAEAPLQTHAEAGPHPARPAAAGPVQKAEATEESEAGTTPIVLRPETDHSDA